MSNTEPESEVVWRLLEAKCNQLKEAISAARLPFFLSLLWGFIWFIAIYTHDYGYTNSLLNRYERALVSIDIKEENNACDVLRKCKSLSRYHEGLLADCETIPNDARCQDLCINILTTQHEMLLQRQVESWSLSIPVLGFKLLVFDLGIIGSAGLLFLTVWFYYAARRENYAIRSFVDIRDSSKPRWNLQILDLEAKEDLFKRRHYVCAYAAVSQRFLFLLSVASKPLYGVTIFLIAFPFSIATYNFYTDLRDFLELRESPTVDQGELTIRLVAAFFLWILIWVFSYYSMKLSSHTGLILNSWYLANRDCWNVDLAHTETCTVSVDRIKQKAKPAAKSRALPEDAPQH